MLRAYAGTEGPVIVELESASAAGSWLLPGNDQIEMLYSGADLPKGAHLIFLDAASCAVLGVAHDLPRNARVGLDFIDPDYAVTVNPDDPSGEVIVHATATTTCGP